jgi:hypothetical protein
VIELPLIIVVTHFIADWLLQSDWMALNKSKHWDVLAIHVTVYSVCFIPVIAWLDWTGLFSSWRLALLFSAVTWVTHFITDAITSRITSKLFFIELVERPEANIYNGGTYKEFMVGKVGSYYGAFTHFALPIPGRRHWFFVMIGFDQLIHYVTLAYTWRYLVH